MARDERVAASRRRRFLSRWLLLPTVVLAVLAYGYWHAATHGWLIVSLYEHTADGRMRPLGAATLSLLDDAGVRLADVEFDARGTMGIRQGQVADCPVSDFQASVSTEARSTWQTCVRRQSAWIVTWAERVRAADLRFGACDIRRIPVVPAKSGDAWWLWWLPLPHVGGNPYTVFSLSLHVDGATCTPVPR